jgi:hypothetical protein
MAEWGCRTGNDTADRCDDKTQHNISHGCLCTILQCLYVEEPQNFTVLIIVTFISYASILPSSRQPSHPSAQHRAAEWHQEPHARCGPVRDGGVRCATTGEKQTDYSTKHCDDRLACSLAVCRVRIACLNFHLLPSPFIVPPTHFTPPNLPHPPRPSLSPSPATAASPSATSRPRKTIWCASPSQAPARPQWAPSRGTTTAPRW